jgi:hypothetical protein
VLRNSRRLLSIILITLARVTLSGRQLEVKEKVDIKVGKGIMILDADILVVYN